MLCGSELELLASDPSLLYSRVAPIGQGVGRLHKDVGGEHGDVEMDGRGREVEGVLVWVEKALSTTRPCP